MTTDEQQLTRLREALALRAEREQVLDLGYTIVASPIGDLLLAATTTGIARVAFANQDHDRVLSELAERVSPRILRSPARLDAAARQLEEYFAGRRRAFDLAVDLRLVDGFRREVIEQLRHLDYGSVASYGEIAAATGRPRAARAVGSACRFNPVPIVVPCHRVVRSDGSAGQYVGGENAKRRLLAWESGRRDLTD